MSASSERRVVDGCNVPSTDRLQGNELAWIEHLRIVYANQVLAPNFDQVMSPRHRERRDPVDSG
jgi:hypothetical protein